MKQGKYPDAFYRVSVKAVITNKNGDVFSVQEGEDWTLPGGGVDHGEDLLTALRRELYEEAFIESDFTAEFVGTESFYVDSRGAMALWVIFRLEMTDTSFSFRAGKESDTVAFRDPLDFKYSSSWFEQIIFKYGVGSKR